MTREEMERLLPILDQRITSLEDRILQWANRQLLPGYRLAGSEEGRDRFDLFSELERTLTVYRIIMDRLTADVEDEFQEVGR